MWIHLINAYTLTSECARPERVNKWPKSTTDIWWRFCTEQKWKYTYLSDRIKSLFCSVLYYMVKPKSIHSHFLYEHFSTFRTFWRGAKSLIYLDVWIECVLIDIYVESLLFDSTVPYSKVHWDFLHCVIPFITTVCNSSKTVIKVNTCYSYILFWLLKNCTHNRVCIFRDMALYVVKTKRVYEGITTCGTRRKLYMIPVGKWVQIILMNN
jgi:hypothetical protein